MFAAVLDTNALWPSLQRDFLLSLAVEGMYRPLWSAHLLAELRRTEELKLRGRGVPDVEAQRRSRRLIEKMRRAFDDAEVTGYRPLIGSFGLPDPKDEHVLAAAVVGQAGAIVTSNLKHFPSKLCPPGVEVLSPSEFAVLTAEIDPIGARAALRALAARSGSHGPQLGPGQIVEVLEARYAMAGLASVIDEASARLDVPLAGGPGGLPREDEHDCQQVTEEDRT